MNIKLSILGIIILLGSCSSNKTKRTLSLEVASREFDLAFPRSWPPKVLKSPLSLNQKNVLINTTDSLEHFLNQKNIRTKRINEYEFIVLPVGEHYISQKALRLNNSGVKLKYNSLYFANNPFSGGTFQEENREMIISHASFKSEDLIRSVIEHEEFHVEVFSARESKKPSLIYCRFRGEQFKPHLLACDEMEAYKRDIEKMMAINTPKAVFKNRLKVAQMHTAPILDLIKNLELNSAKKEGELYIIEGRNSEGTYTVDFPSYSFDDKNISLRDYLGRVKALAKKNVYSLKSIEKALK